MKIWFMFDNFTFARIDPVDYESVVKQARELFAEDGCGSLFVRDELDGTIEKLTRMGRSLGAVKGWGLPVREIEEWAQELFKEIEFERLMTA